MKSRYKIMIIVGIAVVSFFVWPIPYNEICNMFDNYDPCSRITGIDIPIIDMLQYDTTLGMIDHLESNCDEICPDDHLSKIQWESIKTGDIKNTFQEPSPYNTSSIPTKNPSECWYQEDDGSMTPCKMGGEKSLEWAVMMFLILFWPYIILGITIVIIFMVWRKRK